MSIETEASFAAPSSQRSSRRLVLTSALLILVNSAAVLWAVAHTLNRYDETHDGVTYLVGQDIWQPLSLYLWVLIVANGFALAVPRRSRPVGLGILAAAAILFVAFWCYVLFLLVPSQY